MATEGTETAPDEAPEILPAPYAQIFMPPANLPPPKALVMDDNVATNWKAWKKVWTRYEIATGISKQEPLVRVSTLLSVIGEDATKAFDTFEWGEAEDETKIEHVLAKFDAYCEPRTQVIYERYRFNNRKQEPGENIAAYLTELKTIAKNCQHEDITPEEILRDRIVLGIRDDKIRERLLRFNDLTLQKAVDLIKAAEQTEHQVKLMGASSTVNALNQGRSKNNKLSTPSRASNNKPQKQTSRGNCGRCGKTHAKQKCPTFGQKCHRCGNMNHYQALCRSKTVATVQVDDGPDQYEICTVGEQPSRVNKALVNLYVNGRQPGNEVRFQVDTGSECDLLPLKVYKSITGDYTVECLRKCKKSIVSYTGERKQIAGKISLPVWHKNRKKTLTFNVVNGDYQPILSLNTSVMLGLVTLADCDVLSLTTSAQNNAILEEYKDVFEGLGELPGEYKIITDERVKPKVHPPEKSTSCSSSKNQRKVRRLSTAKCHHTSNRAYRMGLKYAGSYKAEQNSNLFGPKGLERGDQARALPDAYYRRSSYST